MARSKSHALHAIVMMLALVSITFFPAVEAQTAPSTWTVLIYLDAEGNLEESGVDNMLEMEGLGAGNYARVLVQMDRGPDYDDRDGDWEGTRRYEINKQAAPVGDGTKLTSRMVEDMGEVNMGDGQSLVDFLKWGVKTAPAQHYLVILWDHGGAWDGLAWDHTPIEDYLSLTEMGSALDKARTEAGLKAWDIVYFDACVMGSIEVAHAVGNAADIVIASEELVPGAGGSYKALMEALHESKAITPREMAGRLIKAFGARYAGNLGTADGGHACAGSCGTRSFTSAYAAYNDDDAVLSWYDMSKEPALWAAWKTFNTVMTTHAATEWATLVREARAADRYNYEDAKNPDAMDIGDFARRVRDTTKVPELRDAASAVVTAVNEFVGGYTTSPSHRTSTGVMAKFPVPSGGPADKEKATDVYATNAEYAEAGAANSAIATAASGADSADPEFGDIKVTPTATGVRVTVVIRDANPYAIDLAVTDEESETGEVLAWIRPTKLDPTADGLLATFDWDGNVWSLEGAPRSDDIPVLAPAFTENLESTEYMLEGIYRVGGKGEGQDALLRFDLKGNLLSAWIVDEGASQIQPRLGDEFAPLFLGWEGEEEIELVDEWVAAAAPGNKAWRLNSIPLGAGATGFAAYAEDLAGNSALSDAIVIEFGDMEDDMPADADTGNTDTGNTDDGTVPGAEFDDDAETPGITTLGLIAALGTAAALARRRRV